MADVLVAQQTPKKITAQDSGIVLQQTVRRVRVDVVVTDAQGQPVAGLQASDFSVAEDRKPQTIRQFEWHSEEKAGPRLPKRPLLPPHTFMNLPEAPEHGPLMVLLFDALNTPVNDQLNARAQMLEFLKKSAGRRIAIFYLGDRLRLLQGFSSDTELLATAVSLTGASSLMGYRAELTDREMSDAANPGTPPTGAAPASGDAAGRVTGSGRSANSTSEWEKRSAEMNKNAERNYASELLDSRVKRTLDALVQIGRFVAGLPGRKNLIWYSGSFPSGIMPYADSDRSFDATRNYSDRVKNATNSLNSAEVSIYPIDARGLLTDYPFERKSLEFATMNMIGDQTGGRAFYNTNGLQEALGTAADEGSTYYSLVYAPTNVKFDGSLRRISVHLGRGHYNLAYRRSYFAGDRDSGGAQKAAADAENTSGAATADDAQFGAPVSHQLVFAVQVDAVGAPATASAAQTAALVPYQEQAAKVEHKKFVPPATAIAMQQYVVQYGVLAKQLALPKSQNRVYHSDLSMAALAFDEDGATLWGTETRLKDDIPPARIDNIRKEGFQAAQTFFVPVDTAVLRFVVRDIYSGRAGSMEVRLPLPPEQKQTAGTR